MKIKVGKIIDLSDLEQEICMSIAKTRRQYARKVGAKEYTDTSDVKAINRDYSGVCAEVAFAKMLNVYPTYQLFMPKDLKNINSDIILDDGTRIEVKYTFYKNGSLLGRYNKKFNSTYHVLLIGSDGTFEFRGAILTDDLRTQKNLKTFEYGKFYTVKQDKLQDLVI